MSDRRTVRIVGAVALLTLLIAVITYVVGMFTGSDAPKKGSVPSSNQIQFGIKYLGECSYDRFTLESNVMSDRRYLDYSMRNEYCMAYLAKTPEETQTTKAYLGITGELPEGDTEGKCVLFSVGKKIAEMDDKSKKTTHDGRKVIDITWEEEYNEGKVFVYSLRNNDFLSGNDLELWYFENVDPRCNMVEGTRENAEIMSEGKYHTLYKKSEEMYEYVLYAGENSEIASRGFAVTLPTITEHSDKLIEIRIDSASKLFSPITKLMSADVPYKIRYVANEIISYVRVREGDIVLIIRNAFDKMKYGYGFELPFSPDYENPDSLWESMTYVDTTHVEIEYYTGTDRQLVKQTLLVPYMGNK